MRACVHVCERTVAPHCADVDDLRFGVSAADSVLPVCVQAPLQLAQEEKRDITLMRHLSHTEKWDKMERFAEKQRLERERL